uniref:THD domain-containing protein n=2 Tax=Homalodisca TaxID=139475 RepID=A0A1B6J6W8_9HEMI
MQKQLEQHEDKINSTLHAKNTVSGGVADEVIYEEEEEYDYDSYEYDDEEEPSQKATVKRTTILSESDGERNSTATDISTPSRTRRDVSSQSVPQRDERYVPSTPYLKAFFNSKNKSEGLRLYATYFGKSTKYVNTSEISRFKYSTTEPLEYPTEGDYKTTASYNRRQLNSYRSPEYQEQRRVPEAVRPVRLRHRGQHGNLLLEDVELLLPQSSTREFVTENSRTPREQHCRMLAAHFVGDTSHYNANLHPHYRGNDIMNHPHGFFKDFEPAQWMTESGMLSSFTFNRTNGIFMVKEPGIYFMYAQIFFTARHERSGFYIKKNGDNVAQCMTTSHTSGSDVKRNTCFTAAIIHLHEHDKLSIREVDGSRFRDTSFKDSHSFFGLIQLKST